MWEVCTTDVFQTWFEAQTEGAQENVLAALHILEEYGPLLGRPYADTVKNSKYSTMKELRIQHAGNPIRVFFSFDPRRKAIVLCAGDKTGVHQKRFYQEMIRIADAEFYNYLNP